MPSKSKLRTKQVWFIKNTVTEGPAYLQDLLKQWKIPFRICDLQRGDRLPTLSPNDIVVVLGGPMSANDKTKSMRGLLKWIQKLLKRKIPYLGICLGLQTLVKAAGGKVIKNPVKEIGLKSENGAAYQCRLTNAGKKDPLFKKFPALFPIFQLHGETVVLKKGMSLLAEGDDCTNQIVKVAGNAYGFQGHLELTRPLLKVWLDDDADLKKMNSKALLKEWSQAEKQLQGYCEKAFFNFLSIASASA